MGNDIHTDSFFAMGTRCDVIIAHIDQLEFEGLMTMFRSEVDRIEKLLSIYDPESEFSRVNLHAVGREFPPEKEGLDLIIYCAEMYDKTYGLFDITASGSNLNNGIGLHAKILINVAAGTVKFADSSVSLDPGAFGKGYALDRVYQILLKEKVKSALINFGNSSILAFGDNPRGDEWEIGIVHPEEENRILHIHKGRDMFISTSGNTKANSGHLINPKNHDKQNEGLNNSLMTVSATNALEAEVLSTALYWASDLEKTGIEKSFNCKATRLWIEEYF
jgi:thiamine biosynthesis lipoprotein